MGIVKKVERYYVHFCECVFAASVLLLLLTIMARAGFGLSYDFIVDGIVWLVIWATFLRSGPLFGEGGHLSVKAISERLHGKIALANQFFNALSTLIVVGLGSYAGFRLLQGFISRQEVYARYIPIPAWMVQGGVAIGLFLFSIYAVIELYKITQKMRG